jgi:hypothetical protein
VARGIKLGSNIKVPLYALGGYVVSVGLLAVDCRVSSGDFGRIAIVAFLVGAVIHILDEISQRSDALQKKIDRHNAAVQKKIDDSVGDVYETGERAGVRHERLAAATPQLSVVHDLSPR